MNWIKCSDRTPKAGQKIIIKKIHDQNGKEVKNLVVEIDDELAFWFKTSPFSQTFEWKPYTEKKRTYDERKNS